MESGSIARRWASTSCTARSPTLNVHYRIGNEGVFPTWLNYVISQRSIPPAGSRQAQRARSLKDYSKSRIGGHYSVETTITHDGSVDSICFPQHVRFISSFKRRTTVVQVPLCNRRALQAAAFPTSLVRRSRFRPLRRASFHVGHEFLSVYTSFPPCFLFCLPSSASWHGEGDIAVDWLMVS